jgi:glycosyltransferase involved in cell wall biosynthesis
VGATNGGSDRRVKVLYFCEGYTDIRFVVGLSEMCDLTLAIPERHLNESGLAARLADSSARVHVDAITGGRLAFQSRSMLYLLSNIRSFDVVLSQEMGRGSLNATAAGKVLGVPVVLYLGTSPVEYFRCRRLRRQVGPVRAWASETFLAASMKVTGALSSAVITTGPYLKEMAERVASRVFEGYYCGIDTDLFKPVSPAERTRLRESLQFPPGKFVILFPSRISHEKDPETVLRATAKARELGLDAVVMNLGGGFHEFLACATRLGLRGCEEWVIGRPAVHPMKGLCEYMQAADVVVQASLAEGGGMSPLEALACGTPVVATRVGGMALTLPGIAQLTPPGDASAMAAAFQWVSQHTDAARQQALLGRAYVDATWSRPRAFAAIASALKEASGRPS